MRLAPIVTRAALLAAAVPFALRPLHAQSTERHVLRGRDVAVWDPAGRVQLVAGSGSDVTVEVTRGGRDAARLDVRTGDVRGVPALRVVAPGRDLVYPEMGRWSNTTLEVGDDGTFGGRSGFFSTRRLAIRGSGRGTEAWADLTVRVPQGARVVVHLGAGEAAVSNVDGDLTLDVHVARINTEHTRGRLSVDAGAGSVRVSDAQGSEVKLDTGSGSVEVAGVRADQLVVDAGSGGLRGRDIDAARLDLDTGSGSTQLARVRTRAMKLDSGSGSVDVEFLADVDEVMIDSGSGSVTLRVPPTLGATLDVDSGSGGIRTEVPIAVTRHERDHLTGRIGDGRGRIVIDSGSGTVRLVAVR